jgi:hypothetical protein
MGAESIDTQTGLIIQDPSGHEFSRNAEWQILNKIFKNVNVMSNILIIKPQTPYFDLNEFNYLGMAFNLHYKNCLS